MEKIKKSRKNEKGSITLFVLVAMLFFIVIVFLSYMGVFNKMASQEKDIQKIEDEYKKSSSIEEMEEQYQEIMDKVKTDIVILLTPNTTKWTNSEVTVTAEFQTSLNIQTTLTCTGIEGTDYTINENTVVVKTNGKMITATAIDETSGNKVQKELTINNIDKTEPTIASLTASTTNWTNSNVTLTGKATDTLSGISYYQFSTSSTLTSSSSGWTSITNTKSEISKNYMVTATGTYYFYVKDAAGNINKTSVSVKIDKAVPTISSVSAVAVSDSYFKMTITASDTGGSGLSKCYISGGSDTRDFTISESLTISNILPDTTYQVYVIDEAGNKSIVKTVTTTALNYNINNTYWTPTLVEAIEKASSGNTIKLLNSISDDSVDTIETGVCTITKNLTFDLNSKTLTRGFPLIIDSGITATIQSGTIIDSSRDLHGIYNNGTCTLTSLNISGTADRRATSNGLVANIGTMTINGGSYTTNSNTITNKGTLMIQSSANVSTTSDNGENAAIWNSGGTTKIYTATITNNTGISILNINLNQDSVDLNLKVELSGTTVNGILYNSGTFNIYDNTKVYQKNTDKRGVENFGNMTIEGSSTGLYGYSVERGYFYNASGANVWHNGGVISNTSGGAAVWNEGNWYSQGGTISGSSNV